MLKSTEYYQPRAPHPRRPAAELITGLVQATSHNGPTDPWRRIRCAKDTGLRNLPLKGFAQNQLWCEIVALACELLAWTQMLALAGAARRWEPKRLRLRIISVAGRLASSGRRLRLRLAERWPWAGEVTVAAARLQALPSG
jgi:hypothetical protein